MQPQEIFKLIIDANKNAYDNTWSAVNNFQEKADEMMKSAFDNSPLPREAKEAALKNIDAYKTIIKQVLEANKTVYDNVMKTITSSQEKAEEMLRESLERTLLPEEGKKAILTAMGFYKEGSTQIQNVVEENYTKMEERIES